jgi:hypothetical protein
MKMRIVARISKYQITVSGKTQHVDKIEANDPFWVERMTWELNCPDALAEWYTPKPDTAHAFLSVIKRWKKRLESLGYRNIVEILEQEDVDLMPYDEPFTGEPGDHVRVVALVDGQRVEVSGATQQMATLKAESPLYEHIRTGMRNPPPLLGTYGPKQDSALAFVSVLHEWELTQKHQVKILVDQNIATIPGEPGVVY